MIKNNRSIDSYILLLLVSVFFLDNCTKFNENEKNIPIANAGNDDTVQVGMYVILDGSESIYYDDPGSESFIWLADDKNEHETYIYQEIITDVGFVEKGVYNFILIVYNQNGLSDSDTVTIVVNSRQNIVFDDPVMEVDFRWSIKEPKGLITETLLQSADSIRWAPILNNKINSIGGIENCINIQFLNFYCQNIVSISALTHLVKLTKLEIAKNNIIDISPLINLVELEYLDLSENEITDISVLKSLINLNYLDLSYNYISDISPLINCVDLEELYFVNANISDLSPLSNLINLETLWIHRSLTNSNLTPLKTLDSLKFLYLKGNNITDISVFSDLNQMERLYLSDNKIKDISSLSDLPNINLLNLQNNLIENIYPLVINSGLGANDEVILTGNPLDSISIYEYIPTLKNRGIYMIGF